MHVVDQDSEEILILQETSLAENTNYETRLV